MLRKIALVGALLCLSAGSSQAALTLTIAVNGDPNPFTLTVGPDVNASLSQTGSGTMFDGGGINFDYTITSFETMINGKLVTGLSGTFDVDHATGTVNSVVITLSQNLYGPTPVSFTEVTWDADYSLTPTGGADLDWTYSTTAGANSFSGGDAGTTINVSDSISTAGIPLTSMTNTFTQVFTLSNGLAIGEGFTFSANSTLTAATPLPATVVGAVAGLPVLGLFGWVRRKKVAPVEA